MPKGRNVPPPSQTNTSSIDPEEREAQMRFILDRWPAIAALAWAEYQREGRGAVALRVVSRVGEGRTEAIYISEQAVRTQGVPWPDQDTERMVADYRPETQVVIAVEREGGGSSTYRLAGPVPPPEAYRRQARRAPAA